MQNTQMKLTYTSYNINYIYVYNHFFYYFFLAFKPCLRSKTEMQNRKHEQVINSERQHVSGSVEKLR